VVFLVETAAVVFILTQGPRHYQLLGLDLILREVDKPIAIGLFALVLRSLVTDRSFWLLRSLDFPLRFCLVQLGVMSRHGLSFQDGARFGLFAGLALGVIGAIQYHYACPTFDLKLLAIGLAGCAGGCIGALWIIIFYHGPKRFTARAKRICLALAFAAAVWAGMDYFQHFEAWGTEPLAPELGRALAVAAAGSFLLFRVLLPLAAKKRYLVLVILVLLAAAGLLALSLRSRSRQQDQATNARTAHRRVLFVTIDTLRADHLGCYGYPKPTSPTLDRLAQNSLRFSDAYCTMPTTDPSHLSMMTGFYPRTLGVPQNGPPLGKTDVPSLPRFFQKKGFTTGAIVSRAYLGPKSLDLPGFDFESAPSPRLQESRADEAFRRAANWLTDHYDRDFFLWLHFYDPHGRYDPPPRFARKFTDHYHGPVQARTWLRPGEIYSPADLAYRTALYDGEIAYADETLGRLITFLDNLLRETAEKPLIVVVGDHGEMLGELQERYGYAFGHGEFLYQPLVHVPLIISWPGHLPSGRVMPGQVDLVDLAPTLVDLVFPGEHFPCQGQSLAAALDQSRPWPRAASFSQRRVWVKPSKSFHRGEQYMVKEGSEKLIYGTSGSRELYDLTQDSAEIRNLAPSKPDRTAKLFQDGLDWEARTPYTQPRYEAIDRTRADTLRGLGYVQ
jgi:arylsulfatase A-like enzyme